jgi:hypothetical protein
MAVLGDPAASGCGGFWPRVPGWHEIVAGGRTIPILVGDSETGSALACAARRDATLALTAAPRRAFPGTGPPGRPGPAWPWFVAWLCVMTLLWWLERQGRGRGTFAT